MIEILYQKLKYLKLLSPKKKKMSDCQILKIRKKNHKNSLFSQITFSKKF